jgi:hypothetical protein
VIDLSSSRLEQARREAGLSVDELWIRYFGNGGTVTADAFRALLAGSTWSTSLDYDIVVSALNDRFNDLDLDRALPYSHDSPPPG